MISGIEVSGGEEKRPRVAVLSGVVTSGTQQLHPFGNKLVFMRNSEAALRKNMKGIGKTGSPAPPFRSQQWSQSVMFDSFDLTRAVKQEDGGLIPGASESTP